MTIKQTEETHSFWLKRLSGCDKIKKINLGTKANLDLALDFCISGQQKHPEDSWLFISQTQERLR